MTTSLVALNVIAYAIEIGSGTRVASARSLVDHGALYGVAVLADGQWWRIVTGAFMHGGVMHLLVNMLALWSIGAALERTVGSGRTLAIYAASLAGSGYAIVRFAPDVPTVGASGAIFGLFGALLAVGLRLGKRGRDLVRSILPILVLNVVVTFAVPVISKQGHFGGLVVGFVVGLLLYVAEGAPLERADGVAVSVRDERGVAAQAELLPPEAPTAG